MYLAGIDLAWQSEINGSGLAFGILEPASLRVLEAKSAIFGLRAIDSHLDRYPELAGLAIDAPLIINNERGQRDCERLLAQCYASRKASCHASNQTLYPNAASVQLAITLQGKGFMHAARSGKFQLECYPHPALIEIFGLRERLLYKKGRVSEKREGQTRLAALLAGLSESRVLPLILNDTIRHRMRLPYIRSLRGQALKDNEDMLDSIVCLYVAALYAMQEKGHIFGTTDDGYIYVPQVDCRSDNNKLSGQDIEN